MSNAEQSAYPHTRTVRDGGYMKTITEPGLTKRELFAAMAMQGALAAHADMNGMRGYEGWREEFSRESIRFADALLAELAKDGAP